MTIDTPKSETTDSNQSSAAVATNPSSTTHTQSPIQKSKPPSSSDSENPSTTEPTLTTANTMTSTRKQQQKPKEELTPTEELLASQLLNCQRLANKRPLQETYGYLLQASSHQYSNQYHHSPRPPRVVRDKRYGKFGAGLRSVVEAYMAEYGAESVVGADQGSSRGIGRYRKSLEAGAMKAAFTLREGKPMDEKGYIRAALEAGKRKRTTAVSGGVQLDEGTRQKKMEAMALGCQECFRPKDNKLLSKARQKMLALEKANLEREKAKMMAAGNGGGGGSGRGGSVKAISALNEKLQTAEKQQQSAREREAEERDRMRSVERERQREKARRLAEQKEREKIAKEKEEAARRARLSETSEEALYRLYEPIFRHLWDMEFANLHYQNPFRIVIDASNCASMGCPDYVDVVKVPMNLTYIKEKVYSKKYVTLQEFFEDVKLLISNALLYNSDPNNEYHKAANILKKKFQKLGEKVMNKVQNQI